MTLIIQRANPCTEGKCYRESSNNKMGTSRTLQVQYRIIVVLGNVCLELNPRNSLSFSHSKMKLLKCLLQTKERRPENCTSQRTAELGYCLEQEKLFKSPLRKAELNVVSKFRSDTPVTETSIFKLWNKIFLTVSEGI